MSPVRRAALILRYLGPGFVTRRLRIALEKRLGHAKRVYRHRPWDSIHFSEICGESTPSDIDAYAEFKRAQAAPFVFPFGEPPKFSRDSRFERSPDLAERVELARHMRPIYLFRQVAPEPVDWSLNQLSGKRWPLDRDWFEIADFDPRQGDARTHWDPARAAWALDLARGASRTGFDSPVLAETFWRWVDSFVAHNPPYRGPHWKCGQESSVRLLALCFGVWAFGRDAATTPARLTTFAKLAWATGYRVAHHIGYAISQKNNHAFSEAVGLMLVAQLFPEFREAARWGAIGRRVLEREIDRQIYADGSYVQHSFNYHRVMLEMAGMGLRLADLSGRPFSSATVQRVARANAFLISMMDPIGGRVPNYGHNDGAQPLPLTECDFTDYRPTAQWISVLTTGRKALPDGPWDEMLDWLGGADAAPAVAKAPPAKPSIEAHDAGGYFALRCGDNWGMLRAHTYRDRPAQCDALSLDVWRNGVNVLGDGGTFQYYMPDNPRLERFFGSTAGHNTVEIDGGDPIEKVSRFLYLPWPTARATRRVDGDAFAMIEAEHADYPGVTHRRRAVLLADGSWVVVDDLLGERDVTARLRWRAIDVPNTLADGRWRIDTPIGEFMVALATLGSGEYVFPAESVDVLRGVDDGERIEGWAAPYYAELRPAPTLIVTLAGRLPLRFVSVLTPHADQPIVIDNSGVRVGDVVAPVEALS
ncbi:MAG: alginate lyase family protein [Phycisphaerales bacterium]|nr:alginate lyase family protein [Phycisphaerales bacterium]